MSQYCIVQKITNKKKTVLYKTVDSTSHKYKNYAIFTTFENNTNALLHKTGICSNGEKGFFI